MVVRLVVGPLMVNCYIVGCKETKEAVVIDPGGDVPKIVSELVKKDFTVKYILNTHGHWDHTGGNDELGRITGAPLMIHSADVGKANVKTVRSLEEGQVIRFGAYGLRVLHTPGHSPGSVCFSGPGAVFSGDTLFAGSIGRTDLPGGSYEDLLEGVREKLFCMEDDTRVYPGHGPPSTIGQERRSNPFFR